MRVVWKDTTKNVKPRVYRKHTLYGVDNGWCITIHNDKNIYATINDACNAIDKALGGYGKRGNGNRGDRVKIVGVIDED